MKFDINKWVGELDEALDSYTSLHDPIFSGNAMTEYYQNSKLIEFIVLGTAVQQKESTGVEPSKEQLQAVADKYVKEFSEQAFNGILVYRRQMVVISSTIFEALLNEFLKCYFLENPQKMYSYASLDGNVRFKDILAFSSKEELVHHYACISAKRFTGKAWKIVLNNLETLLKLDNEQEEILVRMLTVRNEIIHEASKKPVEHDDVFDFINAVKDFANSISSKVKT